MSRLTKDLEREIIKKFFKENPTMNENEYHTWVERIKTKADYMDIFEYRVHFSYQEL